MKTILLLSFVLCHLSMIGQTKSIEISTIERNFNTLQTKQIEFDKKLQQLLIISNKNRGSILNLEQCNKALGQSFDSLKGLCDSLSRIQVADRNTMNDRIQNTNNMVSSNLSIMNDRTLWGSVIVFFILVILSLIYYLLTRRIKTGTSSISEVRKAQEALQSAQTKMQEESIKLDNKLLELVDKQLSSSPTTSTNAATDHSLALKVADEIVRIEMNLSRMDASVKGYKQLSKAVQRIKDNFNANGYEIVDMLGKPYNAGMKVVANFVVDEKLNIGQQIITGIIKPQINYNGQMIQAAQITVSQNI